jgi:hypothetical protein
MLGQTSTRQVWNTIVSWSFKFESPFYDGFCGLWLAQVESQNHRFRPKGPYFRRSFLQAVLIHCHQHNDGEFARQS